MRRRLGATGAWVFRGNANGSSFTRGFQSYEGLTFGDPSSYQVVTANLGDDGRTAYARLGGTKAYLFLHPQRQPQGRRAGSIRGSARR